MNTIAVALLLAQSTQGPPRVDVVLKGKRADVVLSEAGKTFGVDLKPDDSTKNDVLFAYLPAVTFDDFRARTANGWNATWQKTKEGWTFVRTKQQEQAEMDRYLAEREKVAENSLSQWGDIPELTEEDADAVAQRVATSSDVSFRFKDLNTLQGRETFQPDTLGRRAMRRFVKALGPKVLADLSLGATVYESGSGTFHDPALDRALETYNRENARLRGAFKKIHMLETYEHYADEFGERNVLLENFQVTRGVSKFVLRIVNENGYLDLSLVGFDSNGDALFAVGGDLFRVRTRERQMLPIDAPIEFRLSKKAAELDQVLFDRVQPFADIETDQFVAPLKNSVVIDVLKSMPDDDLFAYEPSESLIALAKATKKGVVARFDDSEFGESVSAPTSNDETDGRASRQLTSSPSIFGVLYRAWVDPQSGTIVIEPKTPTTLRASYDRDVISAYAKKVTSPLGANVNDFGRLLTAAPDFNLALKIIYLEELMEEYGFIHVVDYLHDFVILGVLDSAQQQIARSPIGLTLRYKDLPPVVHSEISLALSLLTYKKSLVSYDLWDQYGVQDRTNINDVIAFALPNGPPPDFPVNVKIKDLPYVYYKDNNDMVNDLDDAAIEYVSFKKDGSQDPDQWLASTQFHLGSSVEMTVVMEMGSVPLASRKTIVTDVGDGKPIRFQDLPDSVKNEFWQDVHERLSPPPSN